MPIVDDALIGRIFREESGRSVATLIRVLGDIDVAEDAVQEAFALALSRWPSEGLPPNPGGWITTTARRRAIDQLRRESRGRVLLAQTDMPERPDDAPTEEVGPVRDDRLRLIFTCCHPALSTETQIALTLRLLGGLTTDEVARAFLVAEPTMAKRIVRAKHKIKAARIPYRVPSEAELPDRLRPVLAVLYLTYNAGTGGPSGDGLRQEAIRLARAVADLMPDEAEVAGLLALLLLTESRWRARLMEDGALVLLRDQDRDLWDRTMIEEGQAIVRACLRRNQPGPYQIQAAINAVHVDAASIEATDWNQVLALYDQLLAISPTPVVAMNRAIALGEVEGPGSALAVLADLDLDEYHLFHATRADLLRRLGRPADSAIAYRRAADLATSDSERAFLEERWAALGSVAGEDLAVSPTAWMSSVHDGASRSS
ncbi:MAG: RNA polymerase subunit sigma-24 [Chloroflexi bacterium RBG_16_69_14]|nr:MAG: RNA polymerase subunit sigma-24 [Chloroflexi bacterium RBG_16_69_14]